MSVNDINKTAEQICNQLETIYQQGSYPILTVTRSWSKHNPVISGEIARPATIRWYLKRELCRLLKLGADVQVQSSRAATDLNDPTLLDILDEKLWDITKKKLFLFSPERMDISIQRIQHYTGTDAVNFQRYVLLTNYDMHMESFLERFPDCVRPDRKVQMPAYHHVLDNNEGVSIINIGVGPSNAKTLTDHLAVLRPDAMIMVGHCGGIRNHQKIGDFVLASGYMRDDHVLDDALPLNVPITPSEILNKCLEKALDESKIPYRYGTVFTTADRNWEFSIEKTLPKLKLSRSLAIDMESATVATNGFRYRIQNATLLCVSDRPLHGEPKLPKAAQDFYRQTQRKHIDIVLAAIDEIRNEWPDGLPTGSLRSADEPLMGGPADN
jgi:AMP nucleosidase